MKRLFNYYEKQPRSRREAKLHIIFVLSFRHKPDINDWIVDEWAH